ncbi:unnamed protein product [Penicillium olsonii]|nr:unnamed protein product [Penicillium olsonii]CAG8258344.1 unnamed protein product [Penicillium olsonii]
MHLLVSAVHLTILAMILTVTCVDGHDRGRVESKERLDLNLIIDQLNMTTASEIPRKRGVDTEVLATINGQLVSWTNTWTGQQYLEFSGAEHSATFSSTVAPATIANGKVDHTSTSLASIPSSTASSNLSSWADYPTGDDYVVDGFGAATTGKRVGLQDWDYIGNVGNPWGSNIIQIMEDRASQYKHVVRFENENSKVWCVVVWNSYGPGGGLNGFWSPHKALSFRIRPGQSVFVAIDNDSQGGWGAAEGGSLPINHVGQYASTWGEFDMSNAQNDGLSGWDVSCIVAELANMNVSGMQICNHNGKQCSSITQGAGAVVNAYTSADQGKKDKAVFQPAGPVRLIVKLGWSG